MGSYSVTVIAPDALFDQNSSTLAATWQATECAVNSVVRSFRVSVTIGVYREGTLAIWEDTIWAILNDGTDSYHPILIGGPISERNITELLRCMTLAMLDIDISLVYLLPGSVDSRGRVYSEVRVDK